MSRPVRSVVQLPHGGLPDDATDVRREVQDFLREQLEAQTFRPECDAWLTGFQPSFSVSLAERGWVGMTWPREFGGRERSTLERFVVQEELLAAGAPVAAHWIADRQSGPTILRFGTEEQKRRFLPSIARGESYFAIGMSEPDSGSDLASVSTSAVRDGSNWRLNGTKIWTSNAHRCHYMLALCRTGDKEGRHADLTQFIVDLSSSGVTINPIELISGEAHFNEVVLEDVEVPDSARVGEVGAGWGQATSELAYERSGPERFLSTFQLFKEFVVACGTERDERAVAAIGELFAELTSLRQLSIGVATALERGETPSVPAALVKDLGTAFENRVVHAVAEDLPPGRDNASELARHYRTALLQAPGFTLRGGTTEILRGIVARGLGLR